jgi:hypothetical protein
MQTRHHQALSHENRPLEPDPQCAGVHPVKFKVIFFCPIVNKQSNQNMTAEGFGIMIKIFPSSMKLLATIVALLSICTAHWFLSYLMFKDAGLVGLGPAGLSLLLGLMLGAFLISPETVWKLKTTFGYATGDYHVASVADKQTHEIHTKRVNHVGFFLAPFGMIQGMARSGMSSGASPLGLLIFGAAAFLFFTAGAPPTIPSIYAAVSAVALTAISSITIPPSGADDFGPGFTLIFTSAYVYSAFTQLFLWKEKKDFSLQKATSYAFNSWLTAFLTTCVGWALGLNCTSLIKWGGHALYDFSIPLSYFLLYFVAKKFKVEEN